MTVIYILHRTCDAKCHDAKGLECGCICGGYNHGKGHRDARVPDAVTLARLRAREERRRGQLHLFEEDA
jgi:hypothetical protein